MIVVDDDVNAVNNMTKDFPWEECGFSVEASFEDGAEALRWLQTHTTDLVLCDIKMPRMSGIELARHLHAERREEKVIFISGFKDFEYARKAMEYGVLRYCVKPVTFRELRQTILHIREMLDGERGSRAPEEEDPARGHSITDVQIEKIQRYIQAHYAEVTLQTLADYMHMNTSYLSRYFRDKTGKRLFDSITEVRMNAAMDLLRNNASLNITEIADLVGYTNGISFSRAFKKQFGVPPAEFRRNFDVIGEKK